MRRTAILLLVLAVGCKKTEPAKTQAPVGSGSAAPVAVPSDAAPEPKYRTDPSAWHADPAVAGTGKTWIVVSEAEQATQAGRDVLASGGNAVDAAVATAFALAVVHPTAGNIGGGGFAVIRTAKGETSALDFRETAPAAATETMYLDAEGKPTKDSLVGIRAVGVPGAVAGLYELHKKHGKQKWADVLAPAIKYARDGFAIDAGTQKSIERRKQFLTDSPSAAAVWLPGGAVPTTIKLPELAAVLERIAKQGPKGFYEGETAKAITDAMKAQRGIVSADDLKGYKAIWREPLEFEYRGKRIISMPPPSSGGIVLAMTANMLRKQDLKTAGWHSTEHVHWLVEVWRRAFAARNEVLGDPAFVKDLPLKKLLSQEYADALVATIKPEATPSKDVAGILEGNHTTNLCVVDSAGMAIAITTTLNTAFGSGVVVSGFFLNNEMDDFTAKPGAPNTFGLRQGVANKIEPGKRMLSSMSPTIIVDDKGLLMVVGAQGGPRIITAVWQTLSNAIDFGLPIDQAVGAPRIHHQHFPDVVDVEAESISKDVDAELRKRGYTLDWTKSPREFAAANAILRTATGWQASADPRGGGAAMGD